MKARVSQRAGSGSLLEKVLIAFWCRAGTTFAEDGERDQPRGRMLVPAPRAAIIPLCRTIHHANQR